MDLLIEVVTASQLVGKVLLFLLEMGFLKVICLFLLFESAFSDGELLKPCAVEDTECLSKSTETFLERTSAGIPDYDIKAIDPLIISYLDIPAFEGSKAHLKDVNVTGLKNLKIRKSDFKMDTAAKSVLLPMTAELNIVAEINYQVASKSFSGAYNAKVATLTTARYNYAIKTDEKGIEHFDVGPETISCETLSAPEVTYSQDLKESLNDPDVKEIMDKLTLNDILEQRKKIACKVVEEAYATVVHNIRASAKNLPKASFFTNV